MNTLMMTLQQPLPTVSMAAMAAWAERLCGSAGRKRAVLPVRRYKPRHAASTATTVAESGPQAPVLDEGAPAGGWFDSSHDLRQGLVVLEHSDAHGLGAELPVTVWLDLVLRAPDPAPETEAPCALLMTPLTQPVDLAR